MTSTERFVIAVDFGTIFTAVAWANAKTPHEMNLVDRWPKSPSDESLMVENSKVRSDVAYKRNGDNVEILWGYQIPYNMPRLRWTKLAFAIKSREDSIGKPEGAKRDPYRGIYDTHDPFDVTADYLTMLKDYVIGLIHKTCPPESNAKFSFILTVSAVWSPKVIKKYLDCAKKAGMAKDFDIEVISAPAAGAFHTLTHYKDNLKPKDICVILDLGSGTVEVLTVRIRETSPCMRYDVVIPERGLDSGTCANRYLKEVASQADTLLKWAPDEVRDNMDTVFLLGGFGEDPWIYAKILSDQLKIGDLIAPPFGTVAPAWGALAKELENISSN